MITFRLILTTFELSSIFGGSWNSIGNWLEPKIEPPSGNLACPNLWNDLHYNKIMMKCQRSNLNGFSNGWPLNSFGPQNFSHIVLIRTADIWNINISPTKSWKQPNKLILTLLKLQIKTNKSIYKQSLVPYHIVFIYLWWATLHIKLSTIDLKQCFSTNGSRPGNQSRKILKG